MFGHSDGQQSNQNGSTTEPVEDGMLSMPINDSGSGISQQSDSDDSTMSADQPLPTAVPQAATPMLPADSTPDDLISIKQEALQQLKPLVGHLEQTPEEKFRTTMMMIQAADDQSLIGDAYAAAKEISDEKLRAQALLDVVNEINYFTAQNNQ